MTSLKYKSHETRFWIRRSRERKICKKEKKNHKMKFFEDIIGNLR